jgi:hypothetical protein
MLQRHNIEFNVVEHCNLRCRGCDHGSPLLEKRFVEVEDFARDLQALARVLHVNELRLVGGEPLMHPRLLDLLRAATQSGIADKMVLITNGVLLHTVPSEVWKLVDLLWLSIYPGIRPKVTVEDCEVLAREHGFEFKVRSMDEFRLTVLNHRIDDSRLVEDIYRRCAIAHVWACHTLHNGNYYKCSPAPFMRARLARLGIAFDESPNESVSVYGDPEVVEEHLTRYLADPMPLAACSYCLGDQGPAFPHRQLGDSGVEWLAEDHHAVVQEMSERLRVQNAESEARPT